MTSQRPSRVCREVSPEASCGGKSAQRSYRHSETEGIPTGRIHVRGVRSQRRESAERGGLTDEILACPGGGKVASLRMTLIFLSFWGKCATAAGGRKRERVCGGERERKEAR